MKSKNEVKKSKAVEQTSIPQDHIELSGGRSVWKDPSKGPSAAELEASRDAEREAMKAAQPKAKDRKKQFSRFNQPVACRMCGKNTTYSEANGLGGLDLCKACFDAATLENAHFDGHHQEAPSAICPLCVVEAETAVRNKAALEAAAAPVVKAPTAEAQTTEVAKEAFAAALLKPKATKRKKTVVEKVEDLLAPVVVKTADLNLHHRWTPTVQETASALFAEIETLVKGAGPLVVKVPEASILEQDMAAVPNPDAGVVADANGEVIKAEEQAPVVDAPVAPVVSDEELKKLQAAAKLAKKAAKAKAPVTPAKAKKAVEALVAKVVAVVAEKAADGPLTLRLYAKGHFWFGKKQTTLLQGLPYVKVAVDGKQVTLTPTKSAKDAVEVKFSHGSPQIGIGKLLAESGWSKATQDLAITMVGDAIQVVVQ